MTPLDPFDLPDWLGEGEVTWTSDDIARSGASVAGCLTGAGGVKQPCDLLAVDLAYPAPVVDDRTRTAAHQAWMHGQVLLVDRDGRATVAVPGTSWSADRVMEAVTRVARAVGTDPGNWSVRLGLTSR